MLGRRDCNPDYSPLKSKGEFTAWRPERCAPMSGERPVPQEFAEGYAAIMNKLEEVACMVAALDVIAADAYQRGFEAGRAERTPAA
jgi:hypothetical protein